MRLIDADEVARLIQARYECPEICKREIDAIKTVDPVKHGRWIKGTSFGGVRCSECDYGSIIMLHYSSKYCPNCGAKMDDEV